MKYFMTEQQRKKTHSTCYHEFFQGSWDMDQDGHWNSNSLMIHDDIFCKIGLDSLLAEVNDRYDYFGVTTLTKDQWGHIIDYARDIKGELWEAILEINPWAENCYKDHSVITVLGI